MKQLKSIRLDAARVINGLHRSGPSPEFRRQAIIRGNIARARAQGFVLALLLRLRNRIG